MPPSSSSDDQSIEHLGCTQGCDASIMIVNSNGDDEWRHSDNQSLKREGFQTVLSAKAAVDSDPQCRNKVSCADILALAARESVVQVPSQLRSLLATRIDHIHHTLIHVQLRERSEKTSRSKRINLFQLHPCITNFC